MRLLLLIVAEAAASSSSQEDGYLDALIEEVEWDDGQYAEELEGVSSGELSGGPNLSNPTQQSSSSSQESQSPRCKLTSPFRHHLSCITGIHA